MGNQRARQEAVAMGDDVQANFWKLLNNANFSFDCRDNSQNRSLHLIYDEQAGIEFINKYEVYDSNNCSVSEEAMTDNVRKKYKNMDDVSVNNQPFIDTLKKRKSEKVRQKFKK